MSASSPVPVCLITGGSAGIGLETACLFAEHGYHIAICGRNREKLSAACSQIEGRAAARTICQAFCCDLAQPTEAAELGKRVVNEFGRIDVLVNNAALAPLAPFGDIAAATFENALDINVRSVFYLTQLVWRKMVEQGGGVIVNISSLAAIDPFTGFSLYGSTKAWLDLLTVALADEGKEHGIRVYSIRPGAVETSMLRGLFPDFPPDQCVLPADIAAKIWQCVAQPQSHPSGSHYPVTLQP